jgi:hypothetical protein
VKRANSFILSERFSEIATSELMHVAILSSISVFILYLWVSSSLDFCRGEDINPGAGLWYAFIGMLWICSVIINTIYFILSIIQFIKQKTFRILKIIPLSISLLTFSTEYIDICKFF